jgi:hypothetical protein
VALRMAIPNLVSWDKSAIPPIAAPNISAMSFVEVELVQMQIA